MYDAACPAGFEDTPGNGFDTLCIPTASMRARSARPVILGGSGGQGPAEISGAG